MTGVKCESKSRAKRVSDHAPISDDHRWATQASFLYKAAQGMWFEPVIRSPPGYPPAPP